MFRFAPNNREFLLEKFFSFPLSLLIILMLSPQGVGDAYLILGHAHFMMTALYQCKMGRVTWRSFIAWILLFALFFYVGLNWPSAFTLFVATCLLFHVYFGEARHIKRSFSPEYLLMTLALIMLLSPWLAIEMWELAVNSTLILLFSGMLTLLACIAFVRKEKGVVIENLFITLLLLYGIFVLLELAGMRPSPLESFGFIVMAHYFATYFNVFRSFARKGEGKQWVFVWESIGMNLLFLVGFIFVFFYLGTNNALYTYVYHPISFYVWTLMHFVTTMNFKGYRDAAFRFLRVPLPQEAPATVSVAPPQKNPMDDH